MATINHGLAFGGGFLDPQFRQTRSHRFGHAAHIFNFLNQFPSGFGEVMGELFDIVRPSQRVDHIGHACFFLQHQLRVARDTRREFGGQRNRLIKRIGMQALRPAQDR